MNQKKVLRWVWVGMGWVGSNNGRQINSEKAALERFTNTKSFLLKLW